MPFGLRHLVALLSVGLRACWAQRSAPVVVGQTFLAGGLDPTCDCSDPWALTSHGVSEKLFTVDANGDIVGQVAQSVTKVPCSTIHCEQLGSEFAWDVTIKSDHKFSDGTTVTAAHVAAALTELNTQNAAAQSSLGTMTMAARHWDARGCRSNCHRALDAQTVRIQSTSPTHAMESVLAEWPFVVYYKDAAEAVYYTGPYAVASHSDSQIDLVPNEHYSGATERPLVTLTKFAGGQALAEAAQRNQLDIGFHLPTDMVAEVQAVPGQSVVSFETGYHNMMVSTATVAPAIFQRGR